MYILVLKCRARLLKSVVVTKLRSSGPLIRGAAPISFSKWRFGPSFCKKTNLCFNFSALIRVSGQNCAKCSAHEIQNGINSVHGFGDKVYRI